MKKTTLFVLMFILGLVASVFAAADIPSAPVQKSFTFGRPLSTATAASPTFEKLKNSIAGFRSSLNGLTAAQKKTAQDQESANAKTASSLESLGEAANVQIQGQRQMAQDVVDLKKTTDLTLATVQKNSKDLEVVNGNVIHADGSVWTTFWIIIGVLVLLGIIAGFLIWRSKRRSRVLHAEVRDDIAALNRATATNVTTLLTAIQTGFTEAPARHAEVHGLMRPHTLNKVGPNDINVRITPLFKDGAVRSLRVPINVPAGDYSDVENILRTPVTKSSTLKADNFAIWNAFLAEKFEGGDPHSQLQQRVCLNAQGSEVEEF